MARQENQVENFGFLFSLCTSTLHDRKTLSECLRFLLHMFPLKLKWAMKSSVTIQSSIFLHSVKFIKSSVTI